MSSGNKGNLSANRYAPLNWQQNSNLQGGGKYVINLRGLFRGFCHKFQSKVHSEDQVHFRILKSLSFHSLSFSNSQVRLKHVKTDNQYPLATFWQLCFILS